MVYVKCNWKGEVETPPLQNLLECFKSHGLVTREMRTMWLNMQRNYNNTCNTGYFYSAPNIKKITAQGMYKMIQNNSAIVKHRGEKKKNTH